jgi:hypothetical protein
MTKDIYDLTSEYIMVDSQANIYDLTPELLRRVTERKILVMLRVVCKSLKTIIEEMPEFEIVLSPQGTANATRFFYSHFKGKLTITSNCVSRAPIGWFLALIDAAQHGVQVEKASTLHVNSRTACVLSEAVEKVLSNSRSSRILLIRLISLCFEGSSSGFRKSLSAISKLSSVADEVEISVNLSFRSPLETLWGIIQQIMSLGDRFIVKETYIRFDRKFMGVPNPASFPKHDSSRTENMIVATFLTPQRDGSDQGLQDNFIYKLILLTQSKDPKPLHAE